MNSKRCAVIDTALKLFSKHGYQGIGIDRINDEAKVSKMTMYRYFATKEALIEGLLIRRDEMFREGLNFSVAAVIGDSKARIKAIFEWYQSWFESEDFYGCMFIKATEEFPNKESGIRRISKDHKLFIKRLIEQILVDEKVDDADKLSRHILIILEGLIVNANIFSNTQCVEGSWEYVAELIEHHVNKNHK